MLEVVMHAFIRTRDRILSNFQNGARFFNSTPAQSVQPRLWLVIFPSAIGGGILYYFRRKEEQEKRKYAGITDRVGNPHDVRLRASHSGYIYSISDKIFW
jgi:hypothetical protein